MSQNELKLLCYRTSTSSAYSGKQLPPDGRGENMMDVHNVGQKTGKYMAYQTKRAPLLDRSSCKYTEDFIAFPLADAAFNRQLAANFKSSSIAAKGLAKSKFDGSTKYSEDFRLPTAAEVEFCRPKSTKPKVGLARTLPAGGNLLESKSTSHVQFGPPARISPAERAKPPMPNLFVSGARCGQMSTSYQEFFTGNLTQQRPGSRPKSASECSNSRVKLTRCSSAPAQGRPALTHGLEQRLAQLNWNPETLEIRRAPHLSPGQ